MTTPYAVDTQTIYLAILQLFSLRTPQTIPRLFGDDNFGDDNRQGGTLRKCWWHLDDKDCRGWVIMLGLMAIIRGINHHHEGGNDDLESVEPLVLT